MIEHLAKSLKLIIKEQISGINYGDSHRKPYAYLPTYTNTPPYRGQLPWLSSSCDVDPSFPHLYRELLIDLFGAIGVEYLPEVCLYELESRAPLEVFYAFVLRFGILVEDRLEERQIIDAEVLNRVIGYLMWMDRLRLERLFDSKEIYKLLSQQKFEKVEKILKTKEQS
jgi:hypothetical protein